MYTITVLRTPRPIGQAAKTAPSHGANPGSIPGLVMKALSNILKAFLIQNRLSKRVYPLYAGRAKLQEGDNL